MRNRKTFLICLLILISVTLKTKAQKKLDGDTIYVNDLVAVTIEFPSDIYGDPQLVDPAAPFKLNKKKNSVIITATSKDAKSVNAIISEGKRDHSVVLAYKKGLKADVDDFYDFGTPKKLEDFIKKSSENRKKAQAGGNIATNVTTNSNPVKNTEAVKAAEADKAEVTSLLKDADAAFKVEDWEKAEGIYSKVLKIDNGNAYARKGIAQIADKKLQKIQFAINEYKSKGKKAYEEQNYTEAISQYKKVLDLDQKDLFALGQISEIQKKSEAFEVSKKQNQERQTELEKVNKINSLKSDAAKALSEKRYDEAVAGYKAALELNGKDVFSANKISEIQKIREKEQLKLKEKEDFNTLISDGDKAVTNNEFEVAKSLYASAKKINPTDPALDKKIAAVNEKILTKENEDKYLTAVNAGDAARKGGDLERAKTEYARAVNLFKDRSYPTDQIKEITDILNRESNAKKANAEYVGIIEKADKALATKDLVAARNFYKAAVNLKSDEQYPKSKLIEIDDIESSNKVTREYTLAMQKAKAAFERKDYASARKAYTEAHDIKPSEDEPAFQIQLIDKRISEKDTNAQYDSAIAKGNVAAGEGNFRLALAHYKEALKIRPLEAFALNQVQSTQNMITQDSLKQADTQRRAIARVQEEVRKKRFNEGMEYFVAYDRAAQVADMEKEVFYLKQFLNVFPDESEFNDYQYSKKVADAKKKIDDIRSYWSRTKKAYQPDIDSIPYLTQDLEKKYPDININGIREEQKMIALDAVSVEDAIKITKDLIAEKPRLNLFDSVNNIKLICQGIRFIKEKAYYKLLVQNMDSNDFLTGTMVLNHVKKDGKITSYYPDYVSAFPIILPGKEFYIVYSTKNIDIEDKDNLSFEMKDRLKRTTLKVPIPGKTYNEEKKMKL